MALSGSKTQNFSVNSHYKVKFTWSATQSVSANTSSVTVKAYFVSDSTYSLYTNNRTLTININGNSANTTHNISTGGGKEILLSTRTVTVNHNADGTKSFPITVTLNMSGVSVSGGNLGSCTATATFSLNTIPRKSTLSSAKSFTVMNNYACTVSRASTSFTHRLEIKIGSTLIKNTDGIGASATISFTQIENESIIRALGTASSVSGSMILYTYSGSTLIGSNTYAITINACTKSTLTTPVGEYNIGVNVPFTLSAYSSSFKHDIVFNFNGYTGTIVSSVSAGSISWDTSTIADNLYLKIPNTTYDTVTIYYSTWLGNTQVGATQSITKTLSIDWNTSRPTLPADCATYKDTNTTITAITGNSSFIVQNISTLQVNLNKVGWGNNRANIKQYSVECGGKRITSTNFNAQAFNIGTIGVGNNTTASITITDTRGLSTTVSIPVTVLPYKAPTISAEGKRAYGYEDAITLDTTAYFSNLNIGGTNKNTVSYIRYRYRENVSTSTWSDYTNLTMTAYGSSAKGTGNLSLTKDKSYIFEFSTQDTLGNYSTSTIVISKGVPLLCLNVSSNKIGINCVPETNGVLDINGVVHFREGEHVSYLGASLGTKDIFASGSISTNGAVTAGGLITANGGVKVASGGLTVGSNTVIDGAKVQTTNINVTNEITTNSLKATSIGVGGMGGVIWREARNGGYVTWCDGQAISYSGNKVLFTTDNGVYPNENWTWTSPLPLNACPNGWILVWSDFDPGTNVTNNNNWTYSYIHKNLLDSAISTNNYRFTIPVVTSQPTSDTGQNAIVAEKELRISSTGLGGGRNGFTPAQRDVVLRQILVY